MRFLIILYCLLGAGITAKAGVDLRQGLFYITYTDIEFTGTKAEITRSYNSNNTTTGLFGYGWSSFIETKITAFPDGTLSLSWWGGGLGDYYEPAVTDRKGLYAMVNSIIQYLISNHKLSNDPVAIAEKKSYYLINDKKRAEKYIELQKNKLVAVYIPTKPASWVLDVNQSVIWDGRSFEVKNWSDKYEFNSSGQLILSQEHGYSMQLKYSNSYLAAIIVNNSDTCRVTTDANGRIKQLALSISGKEKLATFEYDSSNNLLYSKDAGDNEYWFSYDFYHNLSRIGYVDTSFMEITYDASSNRVIKVKNRKGNFTTYQYPYFYRESGKLNYDHYATRVQQYDSSGKLSFTQYKEYEHRLKENGSTYLHRMLEKSDTSYHEVLYDAEVGNARYRKKDSKEAWAGYDSKKRPAYLHINDSIYRSRYNAMDLPEYFLAADSIGRDSVVYNYTYDARGELTAITKNDKIYSVHRNDKGDSIHIINSDNEMTFFLVNKELYSVSHKQYGIIEIKTLEKESLENRRLVALYKEFVDVFYARKIAHEWIWDRM